MARFVRTINTKFLMRAAENLVAISLKVVGPCHTFSIEKPYHELRPACAVKEPKMDALSNNSTSIRRMHARP